MAAPNILFTERPRRICYQDWMMGLALCDIVGGGFIRAFRRGVRPDVGSVNRTDEPLSRGKPDGQLLKLPFP